MENKYAESPEEFEARMVRAREEEAAKREQLAKEEAEREQTDREYALYKLDDELEARDKLQEEITVHLKPSEVYLLRCLIHEYQPADNYPGQQSSLLNMKQSIIPKLDGGLSTHPWARRVIRKCWMNGPIAF